MAEPSRRGKTPIVLLVIVLVFVAVPAAAWLMRGTIATSLAEDELRRQGVTCDERFAVELGALFDTATVGPTRCSREGGLVEAIELVGPVTVQLDGLEPTEVRAESLRVVLRDREVRNAVPWAEALRRLRIEQSVAGLVKGLSELSAMGLPPIDAGHVEVTRGSTTVATASGIALGAGAPMPVRADRIAFASPVGVGRLELTGITGTASTSVVSLAGRAEASLGGGLLAMFSAGSTFELTARGLDTGGPRFSLRL